MNIYVGNLSYEITDDEVKDLFSPHGEISSVSIIKDKQSGQSKGFGFVEMPNQAEAEEAIKALNESEANGGTWTDLDVNTDLDNVDTSTLTNELALQLDELSKCFADPNLKEYLVDL